MTTNSSRPTINSKPANNRPAALWLCLYFPHLALQLFSRGLDPVAAAKPVVVLERRRVLDLNQAAFDTGIRLGNNMDTAYSISQEVISFDKDSNQELATLTNLAQWAYQFSPSVSIRAPDCLLIDIGASLALFKGETAILQQARRGLAALGHSATLATSTTPMAALLLARYRGANPATQESPVSTIPLSTIPLSTIPVTYLEADKNIIEALQQMGIYQLEDLLKLPISSINRRFGVYFSDYLRRLRGDKPDPQKYITQLPHFFSAITFMADVTHTQGLLFPIKRLLDELDEFLTARQLHINQLAWKLSHRHHPARHISVYLASPEHNIKALLQLTQLKLEQVKDVREIDTLALTVNQFFPASASSGDLFQSVPEPVIQTKDNKGIQRKPTEAANALLNLLSTRLGPDACFGLSTANDHRPEMAWRRLLPGQIAQQNSADKGGETANQRPLFLLTPPRVLRVIDGAPYLDGKLDVKLDGKLDGKLQGKLELLQGPERIDFGWWDRPAIDEIITRDYYVATQTDNGGLFWIFHYGGEHLPDEVRNNSRHGKWYLHGIFS